MTITTFNTEDFLIKIPTQAVQTKKHFLYNDEVKTILLKPHFTVADKYLVEWQDGEKTLAERSYL